MADVRDLVRWEATDPQAILDQIRCHVNYAKQSAVPCGMVVCFVRHSDEGNIYDVAATPLPQEVLLWMANMIKKKAEA